MKLRGENQDRAAVTECVTSSGPSSPGLPNVLVFDGGTKLEHPEETNGHTAGSLQKSWRHRTTIQTEDLLPARPSAADCCIESDDQKLCRAGLDLSA